MKDNITDGVDKELLLVHFAMKLPFYFLREITYQEAPVHILSHLHFVILLVVFFNVTLVSLLSH